MSIFHPTNPQYRPEPRLDPPGEVDTYEADCATCEGTGKVDCEDCGRTGDHRCTCKEGLRSCSECGGTGVVELPIPDEPPCRCRGGRCYC